jgi:hypothetical protein
MSDQEKDGDDGEEGGSKYTIVYEGDATVHKAGFSFALAFSILLEVLLQ